ncbi:MAG: GNAT family N-acetyltransferase [Cyclonatronaceae bacterium]
MPYKVGGDITVQRDGFAHLDPVRELNRQVFGEDRIINRLDHDPILFLTAHCGDKLAGFKIGYALNRNVFYSAKSATAPAFRNRGVAKLLMDTMIHDALVLGFTEMQYDAFPSLYPGMIVVGLKYGFRIRHLDWNDDYGDFRIRLVRELAPRVLRQSLIR